MRRKVGWTNGLRSSLLVVDNSHPTSIAFNNTHDANNSNNNNNNNNTNNNYPHIRHTRYQTTTSTLHPTPTFHPSPHLSAAGASAHSSPPRKRTPTSVAKRWSTSQHSSTNIVTVKSSIAYYSTSITTQLPTTRRINGHLHHHCIRGDELVLWFVRSNLMPTRLDALELIEMMVRGALLVNVGRDCTEEQLEGRIRW